MLDEFQVKSLIINKIQYLWQYGISWNSNKIKKVFTILGIILTFVPVMLSIIYWIYISPRLFFRVAGEQSGTPILIQGNTRIPFAVSTESFGHVNILNVEVYFDNNEVDLFKTQGIQKEIGTDRQYPMTIKFPEKKVVTKYTLQANYFDMNPKINEFSVKLVVVAEPDHSRLPFWLGVLPVRTTRKEKVIHFRVNPNLQADLKQQGLQLKPKESIHIAGVQSQSGISAITSTGTTTVDVREIFND